MGSATITERFVDIYRLHVKRVYRYCLFRTNSYQDAEDITAEAFIRLLSSDNILLGSGPVLPWLFKVAGNLCANHNRRMAKGRSIEEPPAPQSHDGGQPWEDGRIWQAMRSLATKQQQVIYLRVVEDMSFKDVAGFMNKREAAVKMLFYRAIKRLRLLIDAEESHDL